MVDGMTAHCILLPVCACLFADLILFTARKGMRPSGKWGGAILRSIHAVIPPALFGGFLTNRSDSGYDQRTTEPQQMSGRAKD